MGIELATSHSAQPLVGDTGKERHKTMSGTGKCDEVHRCEERKNRDPFRQVRSGLSEKE